MVQNFGPKMALAIARAISGAKKVSGPSKSLDFVHRDHLESLSCRSVPFLPAQYWKSDLCIPRNETAQPRS